MDQNSLLARQLVEEGIVLLKNKNHVLPLLPSKPLAVFGRGQVDTQIGGAGSGAIRGNNQVVNILSGLRAQSFSLDDEVAEYYARALIQHGNETGDPLADILSMMGKKQAENEEPWWYAFWGKYASTLPEVEVDDELVRRASQRNDTALLVISRVSGGEECDRRVEEDFELTKSERKLLVQITDSFKHVIVILNTVGIIDTSWIDHYDNIDAALFTGLPGQEAGSAIASILAGLTTPSGKLTGTFAFRYEDYPSAAHFSYNKDLPDSILTYKKYGLDAEANGSRGYSISPVTVYQEGIYTGYRYFDTFGIPVMYPIGHGLSYTDFEISESTVYFDRNAQNIVLQVMVTNKGNYSGKQVVQVYVSSPDGKVEKPYQELATFGKTKKLQAGESQELQLDFPISSLSVFDEETAAYVIEVGTYLIRVGNSSRQTHVSAKIQVTDTIIVEQLTNQLSLHPANKNRIQFLSKTGAVPITYEGEREEIDAAPIAACLTTKDIFQVSSPESVNPTLEQIQTKTNNPLSDVVNGSISFEQFAAQLSNEELAVLSNGYGSGQAFGGDPDAPASISYEDGKPIGTKTALGGMNGYVSPAIERLGIPSISYLDGPAGIGLTGWPCSTLLACTWDRELLYQFGNAVGTECIIKEVDVWLGIAINLHRNPIGGRNYEYYSEDPVLTGLAASSIINGVQENKRVTVSLKHFALNEQETYRRGSGKDNIDAVDSIVSERVAREIYLKPFEMAIKQTKAMNVMTAFNKINGVLCGANAELNTSILRGEWRFEGFVVTDWGDMDVVIDGADAAAAGNDVIMPGGPPVIEQVMSGLKEGRVTRSQLLRNVIHLLKVIVQTESYVKYMRNQNKNL